MRRQRAPKPRPVREQVERVSDLLRRKIRGAGLKFADVETRAGWGRGYLSQVLTGKVNLKFDHFFAVAAALGVPARELFAELSPPPPAKAPAAGAANPAAHPDAEPLWEGTAEELRAFIKDVVRELIFGKGRR